MQSALAQTGTFYATNSKQLDSLVRRAEFADINTIVCTATEYHIKNIVIPKSLHSATNTLVIEGNAAIYVDSIGFTRMPSDQNEADSLMVRCRFVIRGLSFFGKGIDLYAIKIGASVKTVIEDCAFYNFQDPVQLYFCMNSRINHNTFTAARHNAITMSYGKWSGGSGAMSPSNVSEIRGNRIYTAFGSNDAIHVEGSTSVIVEGDSIFKDTIVISQNTGEGKGGKNGIYFDAAKSSNVCSFRAQENYFETKFTGSLFYIRARAGTIVVDGVRNVYPNTLFDIASTAGTKFNLSNVNYTPNATKYKADLTTSIYVYPCVISNHITRAVNWIGVKSPKLVIIK